MKEKPELVRRPVQPRKIIGISLPPALAAEVKVEAARRNISLRKLFSEMWTLYKSNKAA